MQIKLLGFLLSLFFLIPSQLFSAEDEQEFRMRAYHTSHKYTEDDVKAEVDFGRNLAARILGRYKVVASKDITDYIGLLGTAVAAQLGRSELKFYFAVIDTDDVNAYACPGGYIFLTKGAIKTMKNEAQLVGVLAHEINHVNERHVVKKLKIKGKDTSISSSFTNLVGGSTASFRIAMEQLTDKAFNMLFMDGVEKEDEFQSDTQAIQMLINLGYDWKSYLSYVEGLKNVIKTGNGKILSKTHPSINERAEKIKEEVNKYGMQNIDGKKNISRFDQYITKNI